MRYFLRNEAKIFSVRLRINNIVDNTSALSFNVPVHIQKEGTEISAQILSEQQHAKCLK